MSQDRTTGERQDGLDAPCGADSVTGAPTTTVESLSPPAEVQLPADGPTRLRTNVNTTFVWSLIALSTWWLLDAVTAIFSFGYKVHVVHGVGVSLFMSWAFFVPASLLFGVGVALALRESGLSVQASNARRVTRLKGWLRDGPPEAHHGRIASVFAAGLMALFALALAYIVNTRLAESIATNTFAGLATTLVTIAALALSAGFYPAVKGALLWLVQLAARLRPFTWLLGRTDRVMTALAGLVILVGIAGLILLWDLLAFLPVGEVGRFLAAVALTWGAVRAVRRWPLPVIAKRVAWGVMALLLVGSATLGLVTKSEAFRARQLFERDVFPSRLGFSVVLAATDLDGDNFSALFGGGDCDGTDASINPGAVDIPGNGIDENCDGIDAKKLALSRRKAIDKLRPEGAPRRPNVVLITVDAWSASHMKPLGYRRVTTPRIDALAKKGVLFEAAFAQGPSTRLSVPAMFTSLYDTDIQRGNARKAPFPIEPGNQLLAEMMEKAGYDTVAVMPAKLFTRWKGLLQGFSRVNKEPALKFHGKRHPHNAKEVTDAAIKEMADKTGPMFMWVHYFDAHTPHVQPKGRQKLGGNPIDIYDAELRFVDDHIGRLVDTVKKRWGNDTLVIITSDHGHGFSKPRYAKHGYGYDLNTPTLHVPLVISAGWLKPQRITGLVSLLDLMPTLAHLLKLKPKKKLRGESLIPELMGLADGRDVLFSQFYLHEKSKGGKKPPLRMVGVRTKRHNMVFDRWTGKYQLWDWPKDHEELKDLYGSKDAGTVDARKRLQSLLSSFLHASTSKGTP